MAAEGAAGPAAVLGAAMARFAPFEAHPELAVAVSGGPDSLSLALLAHEWAALRDGRVRGLIVDHGLRRESAREARRTARWLEGWGIAPTILRWHGRKPTTGIQEAARAARYALLEAWCREHGILHLLIGHHRDDQHETVAHRAERGSGRTGLAGISAVVERPDLRILRPLLSVDKSDLLAWLAARGQAWIDDPTNRDPAFARARLRRDGVGATVNGAAGDRRREEERAAAQLLARAARLDDAGFAVLDGAALRDAPKETARTALAAALRTGGGAASPPRSSRLDALHDLLRADRLRGGRTLAGCRIVPRGTAVMLVREARAVEALHKLEGDFVLWDGRYRVRGPAGWRVHAMGRVRPKDADLARVPAPARGVLPALSDRHGLAAVPHLGWRRADVDADAYTVAYAPRWALAGAPFAPAG